MGDADRPSADELVAELYGGVERFLPQEYRPLVKSFIGMTLNASWPDAVDFFAGVVKEYGRAEGSKGYKQTRAVIDGLIGKVTEYERVQQPPVPRD
jgi:hypothetical protein